MRFLEALLAMLRTLFLLLLIVLFMRPVLKNWGNLFGSEKGGSGREVILLVDCSPRRFLALFARPEEEKGTA
jgi:hypothetical protein